MNHYKDASGNWRYLNIDLPQTLISGQKLTLNLQQSNGLNGVAQTDPGSVVIQGDHTGNVNVVDISRLPADLQFTGQARGAGNLYLDWDTLKLTANQLVNTNLQTIIGANTNSNNNWSGMVVTDNSWSGLVVTGAVDSNVATALSGKVSHILRLDLSGANVTATGNLDLSNFYEVDVTAGQAASGLAQHIQTSYLSLTGGSLDAGSLTGALATYLDLRAVTLSTPNNLLTASGHTVILTPAQANNLTLTDVANGGKIVVTGEVSGNVDLTGIAGQFTTQSPYHSGISVPAGSDLRMTATQVTNGTISGSGTYTVVDTLAHLYDFTTGQWNPAVHSGSHIELTSSISSAFYNDLLSRVGNTGSAIQGSGGIDNVPPVASVSTDNSVATVQSTEVGIAYLVNSAVQVSSLASITSAADNQWNPIAITAANTATNLNATGLLAGNYKVYTVDAAGNLSTPPANLITVSSTAIQIGAGPFIGTDLAYQIYSTEGAEIGHGVFTIDPETGMSSVTMPPGFNAPYLFVVSDYDPTTADYLDEFSGQTLSLSKDTVGYSLRALVPSSTDGQTAITVSPLTELAAQLADVKPGQAFGSDALDFNGKVGDLFGITNPVTSPVIFTNTGSFQAGDGLSESELYGGVLAVLSAADSLTGSMKETIDQLSEGLGQGAEGEWQISSTARNLLIDAKAALEARVAGIRFDEGILSEQVQKASSGLDSINQWIDSDRTGDGPGVSDYADAEIEGVSAYNLELANSLIERDHAGEVRMDPASLKVLTAYHVLGQWAEKGGTTPDAGIYAQAGFIGLSDSEVTGLNARLQMSGAVSVNTPDHLQALLNEVQGSIDRLQGWASGRSNTPPCVEDYLSFGIAGVTPENLETVNLSLTTGASIHSATEFGSLSQTAALAKMRAFAHGEDVPQPTVDDYRAVGLTAVGVYNLELANKLLSPVEESDPSLLRGLMHVSMAANAARLAALERIGQYAENGALAPSVHDYAEAGISGVTDANLDSVNEALMAVSAPLASDNPFESRGPASVDLGQSSRLVDLSSQQLRLAYEALGAESMISESMSQELEAANAREVAMAKIVAFATATRQPSGEILVPAVADYTTAGIQGISPKNVDLVNDLLRNAYLDYQEFENVSDVQTLIDTRTLTQEIMEHSPELFGAAEYHLDLELAVEKFALAVSLEPQNDWVTYLDTVGEANALTANDLNLMLGRVDVTAENMDTVIRHITGQLEMPHGDNRYYEMSQVIRSDAFVEQVSHEDVILEAPAVTVRLVDASEGDELNLFVDGALAYQQVLSVEDIDAGKLTLERSDLSESGLLQAGGDLQAGIVHIDPNRPLVLSDPYFYGMG